MRLALLSDIHGNLLALETVLAEIASLGIDQIVCLGDVAATGPQPHAAVERVRSLDCPVVMGNTDAHLLRPTPATELSTPEAKLIAEIDLWCASRLTPEDRTSMGTFQPTVALDLPGSGVLLCYHGSPRSFHDQILPTTAHAQLEEWLGPEGPLLYAGGHTHNQMLRRFRNALVINPGSVGLPFDRFPNAARNPAWAEYAVVTVDSRRLSVDLRRAPYDAVALRAGALASGMPNAETWAADWE